MDPITIGLEAVGLGMQIFGGLSGASNAKQQAEVSSQISADEQRVNDQKEQQMQLEASRAQTENFRKTQQARAQGLAAATSQGAQFGSGLAGGQAAATDQGLLNSRNISQNLQIGENIFGIDRDISSKKMQLASLGGEAATDQGISSLGGALIKAGPTIGSFGKNIGASGGLFMGGGSPSGYGTG
jgi:hypothetical protein